jgi:cytochrome c553
VTVASGERQEPELEVSILILINGRRQPSVYFKRQEIRDMVQNVVSRILRIVVLSASACLIDASAWAQDVAATSNIIARCESCHGLHGDSAFPTTPRLNGQQGSYLASRFQSFRDLTRQDPHATYSMWGVKSGVADTEIPAIARYFSGQTRTQPHSNGQFAPLGKKIYEKETANAPSCQSCHGQTGEGKGAVPRLAGQHAKYLITQMWVFNFMLRTSETMHPKVKYMTDQQIRAVASYLAGE